MSRIDVDQATILERVAARLRSFLRLTDRQVYETISPEFLQIPRGGDFTVAVAPRGGQFVEGEQVEGNTTEEWGLVVVAYTRIKLDSTDRDEALLRDASRGLLNIKKRILQALVGHDLQTEDGQYCLRQLLHARHCSDPASALIGDTKVPIGLVSIEFGIEFDWDLTTD